MKPQPCAAPALVLSKMRRAGGKGILAVIACLVTAATSSAQDTQIPLLQASPARSFVDAAGVNVQLPGEDVTTWQAKVARLQSMHLRHLRVTIATTAARKEAYQGAIDAGMGLNVIGTLGKQCTETAANDAVALIAPFAPGVESVEGPNEWELFYGDPDAWPSCLAEYQHNLYNAVKSTPSLSQVPVIGPSIGDPSQTVKVPSMVGAMDYTNMHSYSFGEAPESIMDSAFEYAKLMPAPRGYYVTEAGFHNSFVGPWIQAPVSEEVAAAYMPRLFAENFRRGITRTYSWVFADFVKNPPGWPDQESHFGLVYSNLDLKPSGLAVQRLLTALDDEPGDLQTQDLGIAVEGDDVHKVLLQRQDRTYFLLLWRTASLWDTKSFQELSVPDQSVCLTTKERHSFAVLDPSVSGQWQDIGEANWNGVQLAGRLLVVRIQAANPDPNASTPSDKKCEPLPVMPSVPTMTTPTTTTMTTTTPTTPPGTAFTRIVRVIAPTKAYTGPGSGNVVKSVPTTAPDSHHQMQLRVLTSLPGEVDPITGMRRTYYKVHLPYRRSRLDSSNGHTGWVSSDTVQPVDSPWSIVVNRSRGVLVLRKNGHKYRTWRVIVGSRSTPTPKGRFAVYAKTTRNSNLHGTGLLPFAYSPARSSRSRISLSGQSSRHPSQSSGGGNIRMGDRHMNILLEKLSIGTPVDVV